MSAISVSVIIPVYNREVLLSRAIESALSDGLEDLEVIVVDDGSTDDSAPIARSFGRRVRVFSQNNAGSSAARNRGLAEVRGRYVRTLDSDDWLLPGVTRVQVEKLEGTGADVCYGDWREASETEFGFQASKLRSLGVMTDPVATLLGGEWCPPFCYLFRREVLQAAGGWPRDVSLKYTEDLALNVKVALRGSRFVHVGIDIGRYYHHKGLRDSRSSLVGWCNAARAIYTDAIATLDRESGWTSPRRIAVAESLLRLAKVYFGLDRAGFRECIALISRVAPDFRPAGRIYSLLVTLFGYQIVESILEIRRRLRRRVSSARTR